MSVDHVLLIVQHFRYLVVIPITIFEGPIISVLVGYLATHGQFSLWIAYPILVASDLAGDMMYYLIGRSARHPTIWRRRHWLGLTDSRIAWLERQFNHSTNQTLLFGKAAHGMGSTIILGAGIAQVPLGQFLWLNLVGTVPKTFGFLLLGYYLGQAYATIDRYLNAGALLGFLLLVAGIIISFIVTRTPPSKQAQP